MNSRIYNIVAEKRVWNKIYNSFWFDGGCCLSQDSMNHLNPCVLCVLISFLISRIPYVCYFIYFAYCCSLPNNSIWNI